MLTLKPLLTFWKDQKIEESKEKKVEKKSELNDALEEEVKPTHKKPELSAREKFMERSANAWKKD